MSNEPKEENPISDIVVDTAMKFKRHLEPLVVFGLDITWGKDGEAFLRFSQCDGGGEINIVIDKHLGFTVCLKQDGVDRGRLMASHYGQAFEFCRDQMRHWKIGGPQQ